MTVYREGHIFLTNFSPLKISPKILLSLAFLLSLLTAGLVYFFLEESRTEVLATDVPVVVAAKNIPPRTVITSDMVFVSRVPREMVRGGSRSDAASLVGVMTRKAIIAGEQIVEEKLALGGKNMGLAGNIPLDKRAFTIAVNEITGSHGFIKVGDYVDVLGVFDKAVAGETGTRILLQNVEVVGVDGSDGSENAVGKNSETSQDFIKEPVKGNSKSVTVAVRLADAAILALAGEKGKLVLALRPYTAVGYEFTDKTVGLEQLLGHPILKENEVKAPAAVPAAPLVQPALPPAPSEQSTGVAAPSKAEGIPIIRGTRMTIEN